MSSKSKIHSFMFTSSTSEFRFPNPKRFLHIPWLIYLVFRISVCGNEPNDSRLGNQNPVSVESFNVRETDTHEVSEPYVPKLDLFRASDMPSQESRFITNTLTSEIPEKSPTADWEERLKWNNKYPSEQMFYTVFTLDDIGDTVKERKQVDGPIDLLEEISSSSGFLTPTFGAAVTYRQTWYSEGLALGNLIHTLALAPGESTKISMINWSRLDSSELTETLTSEERLRNETFQNRAISEISEAVAREAQNGFSSSTNKNLATSYATQRAKSETGSGGGGFGIGIPGLAIGGGGGYSNTTINSSASAMSTSEATAITVASISGQRNIGSEMAQNISNSTQQYASAVRSQRSSVVLETLQSENETVNTRVVTNYNHMHTLNIQYYETVQAFNVFTEVDSIDRLLYVPVKIFDKWTKRSLEKYWRTLASFALDSKLFYEFYRNNNTVTVSPGAKVDKRGEVLENIDIERIKKNLEKAKEIEPDMIADDIFSPISFGSDRLEYRGIIGFDSGSLAALGKVKQLEFIMRDGSKRTFSFDVNRITEIFSDTVEYKELVSTDSGSANEIHYGPPPVLLEDINEIVAVYENPRSFNELDGKNVHLILYGPDYPEVPGGGIADDGDYHIIIITAMRPENTSISTDGSARVTLAKFENSIPYYKLLEHLNENALHYSRAIWMSLNASDFAYALSSFTVMIDGREKPIISQIDGPPIGYYGNYLIFKVNSSNEWREKYKEDHMLSRKFATVRDVVPVPSKGVFAEAVLGRSNGSEKLDMTRFWNWQDSPIPFSAPEIAAINTGSRHQQTQAEAGDFAQPMVNIVNPQPLPDPAGLGAILSAVTTANMFRDVSGLAQTIGLAQSGLQSTLDAATAAGDQAQANAATAAIANLEAFRSTLSTAQGMATLAANRKTPGTDNISNAGAVLNQAETLDRENNSSIGADNRRQNFGNSGYPNLENSTPLNVLDNSAGSAEYGRRLSSPTGSRRKVLNHIVNPMASLDDDNNLSITDSEATPAMALIEPSDDEARIAELRTAMNQLSRVNLEQFFAMQSAVVNKWKNEQASRMGKFYGYLVLSEMQKKIELARFYAAGPGWSERKKELAIDYYLDSLYLFTDLKFLAVAYPIMDVVSSELLESLVTAGLFKVLKVAFAAKNWTRLVEITERIESLNQIKDFYDMIVTGMDAKKAFDDVIEQELNSMQGLEEL